MSEETMTEPSEVIPHWSNTNKWFFALEAVSGAGMALQAFFGNWALVALGAASFAIVLVTHVVTVMHLLATHLITELRKPQNTEK